VLIQPELGHNIDPKSTSHGSPAVPPHAYFATFAWLAEEFRADAVIHLGKCGTLEGLPAEALALSAECFPEALLASLPRFYPYTVNNPRGTRAPVVTLAATAELPGATRRAPPSRQRKTHGEPGTEQPTALDRGQTAHHHDARGIGTYGGHSHRDHR
jgi:hypothetical protein